MTNYVKSGKGFVNAEYVIIDLTETFDPVYCRVQQDVIDYANSFSNEHNLVDCKTFTHALEFLEDADFQVKSLVKAVE
jgi:hypothetical protein